ncbi:MAG: iron uptake porin, partial [Thermostichales cyanobacterium DRC_bins_46]
MSTKANLWKALLVSPLALGAATTALPQASYAQASGPVTAISELSDVQPTDWAFQALQSLVERYGCIAGYPDRTYRGNRAMTRFEFAAGMNACLDRINELIAAGLADKVSRDDLATLQRLQEEFAAELAALKGRVDALEADVTTLKGQVFNPVTKLNAQVIAALVFQGLSDDVVGITGPINAAGFPAGPLDVPVAIGNGGALVRRDAAPTTLNYRVRLNFDASFVPGDRLRIRLQARDFDTRFFAGTDPRLAGGGGDPSNNIALDDLIYRFPAFNRTVNFFLGLNSFDAGDVNRFSLPFNAISDAVDTPALTKTPSGQGVGFSWRASDLISLSYTYSSASGSRLGGSATSTPGPFGVASGLFAGTSGHAVELGFTPSRELGI